jgi:hypothetical protein
MKMYVGVEVQLHAFLTSALYGGEWPASCPGHFTPRRKIPVSITQEVGWYPEPVWT